MELLAGLIVSGLLIISSFTVIIMAFIGLPARRDLSILDPVQVIVTDSKIGGRHVIVTCSLPDGETEEVIYCDQCSTFMHNAYPLRNFDLKEMRQFGDALVIKFDVVGSQLVHEELVDQEFDVDFAEENTNIKGR